MRTSQKHSVVFALVSLLPIALHAQGANDSSNHDRLLRAKLGPPYLNRSTTVPFLEALNVAGLYLQDTYVDYGVQLPKPSLVPKKVILQLKGGDSLGELLTQVFQQAPELDFAVVSDHLIAIYPRRAVPTALDKRIGNFALNSITVGSLFNAPELFIPELRTVQKRYSTSS